MDGEETRVEKFYNGDYLGAFANLLLGNGWGTIKRKKGGRKYKFSHNNLKDVLVEITEQDIGLFGIHDYEVTLTGPRNQINEFIRAAKRNHEDASHSLESCNNQFREVKKYNGLILVAKECLRDMINKPIIRFEYSRQPVKETKISRPKFVVLGYIKSCTLGEPERSLFSLEGVMLHIANPKEDAPHIVRGKRYRSEGGSFNCSLFERIPGFEFYRLESDKILDEVIERIKDHRAVSLS